MAVTYEPIASQTLGADTATVTLGSGGTLPQGYTDLILVMQGKNTSSGTGTYHIRLRFNGDTATNYSTTQLYGDGSAAGSNRFSSESRIRAGEMPRAGSTTVTPGISIVHIQSYANANVNKTTLASNSADIYALRTVGLWRSTSAITSIDVSFDAGSWASGSTFSLFGVKAA